MMRIFAALVIVLGLSTFAAGGHPSVLVESRDGKGNRWYTVGVSPNIVDASFEALLDSINYKLLRDGAPAP